MKQFILICWGYVVELILAAVAYALLVWFIGLEQLSSFFISTWVAWSTVCGVVLAAAMTLFVHIIQMLTSEFGGYIVSRSADGPFKKAFGFAILYSTLGTVAFIIAGNINWAPATHAAGVLLLLVGINLYTMLANAVHLQRMYALFDRIRREHQHEQQR